MALGSAEAARWMRIVGAGTGGFAYRLWAQVLDAGMRPVPSVPDLPILTADLAVNSAVAVRSGSITVPMIDTSRDQPVDWRPKSWRAPLAPFGNRLRLFMEVDIESE